MLTKIILHNFLSYDDVVVSLEGAVTIAVVGDNGCGKSAFLEALPYAYYGIGRGTLSELSRLTGDGTHTVILEHRDIPNKGDIFIVERGQKKAGKGYTKVTLNGELVGSGASATDAIQNVIRMTPELFMLTAFFGLGDDKKSDSLINVGPADRLETLQKLAEVSIYKDFYSGASAERKENDRIMGNNQSALEAIDTVLGDPKEYQTAIDVAEEGLQKAFDKLSKVRVQKQDLLQKEETFKLAVQRRQTLEQSQVEFQGEMVDLQDKIDTREAQITETVDLIAEIIEDIKAKTLALTDYDGEALLKASEAMQQAGTQKKTVLKLKQTGVSTDVSAGCPLCGSELTEDVIAVWHKDIIQLESDLEKSREKYQVNKDSRKALVALEQIITRYKSDLRDNQQIVDTQRSQVVEATRQLTIFKNKKKKADDEYVQVTRNIADDAGEVSTKIQELSGTIDALQRESGQYEATIKINKKNLIKHTADMKKRKQLVEQIAISLDLESAYALLVKAFHRYGIPLELLRGMTDKLGIFATAVYQEFDNGIIAVVETTGAKPGLEFVLSDSKGTRRWGLLSKGEKVMFFVSVRVALTRLIEKAVNTPINFVVLDEIMGNLSPQKQIDMVRVVSKILRKVFPQVIIVSHTQMNDIFDRSLVVTKENEVSCLTVQ